MATATIENLSIEVLEEILSYVDLQHLCEIASKVNYRWSQAVHHIVLSGYRKFGPIVSKKLQTARRELTEPRPPSAAALDNEVVLVAEYSFLQILYSEYRLIYTIYWNHSNYSHLDLVFEAGVCLREFKRLLEGFTIGMWDWKVANISFALDSLRNFNTRFLHYFFWQVWDPHEEKLGPMILEVLDCSLNSNFSVSLSYDKDQKYENSQCHICGYYEIKDPSCTLKSLLPEPSKQPVVSARMLVCDMCDAIRCSNQFHVLRLRWVCMDRVFAVARRGEAVDIFTPYISELGNQPTETVKLEETRDGLKTVKILQREQPEFVDVLMTRRVGIRCDFQLWCTLPQAPVSLVGRQCRLHSGSLPTCNESMTCKKPYHFKMEFKACVRSKLIRDPLIESTLWVEETAYNISVQRNKEKNIPSERNKEKT